MADYTEYSDADLGELLASYRAGDGPCGMFSRKIHEIEAELHRRQCDIVILHDPEFLRFRAKVNGVIETIPFDWENDNAGDLV